MIITFWDHVTGCWAVGESVFDGKHLLGADDDPRFRAQREAPLGHGSYGRGRYLSKADMRQAKNVLPADSGVWSRSPDVLCSCGRRVLTPDRAQGRVTCRVCRAAKRKLRRRAA